jgi:hypothetical protein
VAPSYAPRATLARMTTSSDHGAEIDRIGAAQTAYAGLEQRVLDGEPWPLAEDFGTGPEASWGPREVLAHVAEMLPFWLGEMERVVAGAPGPTPFGRIADDPLRLGMIERDRSLPLPVLFARIDAGMRDWATRLATLTEAERAAIGLHPRRGETTADTFLETFVIGHAEDHVVQLEAILAARAS